jgi:hypothetical protein
MDKGTHHCSPREAARVAKYFCLPMTANMRSQFERERKKTNIAAILGVNHLSDMNELRSDDLRTCSGPCIPDAPDYAVHWCVLLLYVKPVKQLSNSNLVFVGAVFWVKPG